MNVGARVVEPGRQFGQQPFGLAGQIGGVGLRLVCDGAAQRGVAGERVDVAFLDPVEAQSEHQVFADQGAGIDTGVHADQR